MFAFVGVAGALLLVVAVIGIFYLAGNRGRGQDVANRESAAKGVGQQSPQPPRAEGRGEL